MSLGIVEGDAVKVNGKVVILQLNNDESIR